MLPLHIEEISYVGFEVLKAVIIKWCVTTFGGATLCSLVEVYWRFGRMCCLHFHGPRVNQASNSLPLTFYLLFCSEDGGSTFLRTVGKFLPEYTTLPPIKHCEHHLAAFVEGKHSLFWRMYYCFLVRSEWNTSHFPLSLEWGTDWPVYLLWLSV
jgi:hypothetical protein